MFHMKHTYILPLMAIISACATSAPAPGADAPVSAQAAVAPQRPARMLPKAIVYKTNVPCTDNVVISLNNDGTGVLSYPAPTDVSADSAPLQLPDGWLLDRRGIGPNPAFISMTYRQYAALRSAPSPAELLRMVLPDVHVTELRRLSMTPQQAEADTAAVMAEIRSE